jgi:hypothetical protein
MGDQTAAMVVRPPGDNILPGFPRARKVQGKTWFSGGIRRRWRDPDGRIYEWDYQHGAVEVYDRRGRHLGQFDPATGMQNGPAIPGRTVEP